MSKGQRKTHKAQHFVPQCYTKAWHDPDAPAGPKMTPYVWVFGKDGSNPRRKAPVKLFTENDIYTIELPGGERDLRLEHGFQELEDKFTRIRKLTFERGLWPNDEQMTAVLAFLATLQTRTVTFRNHQQQQWRSIRERMERMERAMQDASPARKRAMTVSASLGSSDRSAARIGLDEVRSIEQHPIQHFIEPFIQATLPILARMHLTVLYTDDPLGFVTTDHPATWFDPEAHKYPPLFRAPALASSTIEVTLPMSPRQCLLLMHRRLPGHLNRFVKLDQQVVDELNRRHIIHCDENYIACRNETRAVWFEKRPLPEDAWENVHGREKSQSA